MAVIRVVALLCLLVASSVRAETTAVISGPAEMEAGNMVVLNAVASKGKKKIWIFPENLKGRYAQAGDDQVFFAVRESGEFTFHLVVVSPVTAEDGGETELEDAVATHTVRITNGIGETKPIDPGPGDPGPGDPEPPTGDFGQLRELSLDAARRLSDPVTAGELASALTRINGQSLADMQLATRVAVEAVFASRKGASRDKDWVGVWRRPVDEAIKVSTPAEYRSALSAIADGLREAASLAVQPMATTESKVVMYTHPACVNCQEWKRDVKPAVEAMGFSVTEVRSSGVLPVFEVTAGGVTHRMVGYQPPEIFRKLITGNRSAG